MTGAAGYWGRVWSRCGGAGMREGGGRGGTSPGGRTPHAVPHRPALLFMNSVYRRLLLVLRMG